jgi:purine-binding chemotaxis protein CheW
VKVVIFTVGKQEFALPITVVREIIPWTAPTVVPEAPPTVEGVIEVRGEILPVVDLGRRFGLARRKTEGGARIIILELAGQTAGWIVDDVVAVETAAAGAVAPPSPLLANLGGLAGDAVVDGILKLGEQRLVVLLDAARVLDTALR